MGWGLDSWVLRDWLAIQTCRTNEDSGPQHSKQRQAPGVLNSWKGRRGGQRLFIEKMQEPGNQILVGSGECLDLGPRDKGKQTRVPNGSEQGLLGPREKGSGPLGPREEKTGLKILASEEGERHWGLGLVGPQEGRG